MSIERKVQLVEALFYQLERESAQFQESSGLGCVSGCGKCCTFPNIEATPLEFLPWAYHLFLNGEAEDMLDKLNETTSLTCLIFKPLSLLDSGRCSDYKYRGLICRLFGAAAITDKYGKLRLATCKIIKEGQSAEYAKTVDAIAAGTLKVPVFTAYYMQLGNIDFQLTKQIVPVNMALKLALEEVLQYFAYRDNVNINKQII